MKSVRRYIFIPLAVAFALLVLSGCYKSSDDLQQELWRDKHYQASVSVNTLYRDGSHPLSVEQLLALLGQPDYKVSAPEFELLIGKTVDTTNRENIMSTLAKDFLYCKDRKSRAAQTRREEGSRNSAEFVQCKLWIYDEARHFTDILPQRPFCLKEGFETYVFFVEDSNCIGARSIMLYTPLLGSGDV